MGNVIQLFPASESQADDQRRGSFLDTSNWSLSRKGNRYLRHGPYCTTVFAKWNGWSYAIARSAAERLVFSQSIYDSEDEARRAAWHALEGLEEKRA